MIVYNDTHANDKPESIRIDKYSVWVATNVRQVEVQDEEAETHTEWVYTLTQYDKDEYIKTKLAEQEEGILELADLIGGML